jgi:hypothetical protein
MNRFGHIVSMLPRPFPISRLAVHVLALNCCTFHVILGFSGAPPVVFTGGSLYHGHVEMQADLRDFGRAALILPEGAHVGADQSLILR